MSYTPVGSYFTFQPHEIMSGYGGVGFGAFDFSADAIWSDWFVGQACPKVAAACARAKNAVDTIRAALQQLGYGQLGFGVMWGSKDQQAMKRFSSDLNLAPGGMPTKGKLAGKPEPVAGWVSFLTQASTKNGQTPAFILK